MEGGAGSLAEGAGSWDPEETISTASAEGGTQGRVISLKMRGMGFALGRERVPGVSPSQTEGNMPASAPASGPAWKSPAETGLW